MTASRLAAARVLLAIERGGTTLAAAANKGRADLHDTRDRALFLELTAGVLRWRAALDAVIAANIRRPIGELAPEVLTALRLAAYQMGHLDRVPAHAIVHESVDLVRALGQPRAAGFVNAVLRRLASGHGRTALPLRPSRPNDRDAALAYLTTTLSHPAWIVSRWLDRYGFEATEAWCAFNNRPPHITTLNLSPEEPEPTANRDEEAPADDDVEAAPWVGGALRLQPGALGRWSRRNDPDIQVQDEGAQVVAHVVGAQPDERVLDLCSSPGGKTLVMSRAMRQSGLLVSADFRPARIRLLAATLARTGTARCIVRLDARRPLPFGSVFDRVLLDAPCSGLGTLRRDPDLKWIRTPEDLTRFAAEQDAMLDQAAEAVREGGRVIYATCSSEPEENDQVVDRFLARRKDFTSVPAHPGPAVTSGGQLLDDRGFLRTLPFRHGIEAYFAAALVRQSGT